MSKKKFLVVDDSALMRRVLSDIINSDEKMTVTHAAQNGIEALKFIEDATAHPPTFDSL